MKNENYPSRNIFSLLLLFALFTTMLPPATYAQVGATAAAPASQYAKALAEIESKVNARRNKLGIPGMSLVIVKDGEVIYIKGLGYKDFEKKIVVTPDTQFAIGSATKAFTALSVLMTQDEGKLSLDDSPKKLLPYFKMQDAETDKNITIRDLLSHSSGLNRTDLAMITGKLSRAELIQVAAQAKPTGKLREKFQYQNIMYAAAGELVTQAQKRPWEQFVPDRIFKPLGMTNSNMSISQIEKAKDFSLGYDYNFDTKETKKRPFRGIDQVGPAGSINSSARDMAEWVKFVLSGGVANGKRLVSEKSFEEWLKPQMKIAGTSSYSLGWFLQNWNGHKVVQHGGNIDGFNSLVAMIPEKKLGFVMLTNVTGSSLGTDIMSTIFSNILDEPKTDTAGLSLETMKLMAGKYRLASAGVDIEIKIEKEDLVMAVPGQPESKMERTGPRQFKPFGGPDGFSVKFMPDTGDAAELQLTQPNGVFTLQRVKPDGSTVPKPSAANLAGPEKELIGKYSGPGGNGTIEIKETDGKVNFEIPGQQPYALNAKLKDTFAMSPLPDSYFVTAKRNAAGKLTAVAVTQPEGTFEFKRLDTTAESKPAITVAELHKKTVEAIGGEANWRKLTTRVTESDIDLIHQGVQGKATSWSKAPNKGATRTTMTALGKQIATGWEYFDGTGGLQAYSFAPAEKFEGKMLEDVRRTNDFYNGLDWTADYKKIEITGTTKVAGEEAYVVAFEPKAGTNFKQYYSTTTHLLLKHDGLLPSSTSSQTIPYTLTFSDYREIDGIKLPYKTVNNNPGNGDIITVLTSVKHNVAVDDKVFGPRKLK